MLGADFDVEAERLHFLDEHVEGLGGAGFQVVVAFDDGFVNARSALDVVGFDGEQLLERVSGSVSFERPDFHFPETLTTILGLTTERLLGNETVGADGAGVNLIGNQVAEFQHVNVADHDLLVERFTGAAIEQFRFAVEADPGPRRGGLGFLEILHDAGFRDTIEDRRGDFEAERFGGDAKVRFQHLTDVHPGRHAERVEDDVHWGSVIEERHVFFRDNLGDNPFVTVTSGHLIPDGEFPLGGDEDLHLLDDAGFHFVAGFHLIEVHFPLVIEFGKFRFEGTGDVENLVPHRARIDLNVIVFLRHFVEERLGDFLVGGDDDFARLGVDHVERDFLIEQVFAEFFRQGINEFVALGFVLFLDLLELLALFGLGDAFLVGVLAAGHADVHDDAHAAGGHAEGGVFYVSGFFTKNGAEETFFRSEFGLGFRSDFADEDVAGFHFGADTHDSIHTQILECFFADVGNIPGDFLRPELGIAGTDFEFLNVNGGVNVLLHNLRGNGDGVFEVVSVPGHEGHEHIAAEGEFALVGAGSVCEDLAFLHLVATADDGALVDAGAGIAAHEFAERVDVDFLGGLMFDDRWIAEELTVGAGEFPILGHNDHFRSGRGDDALGFANGDRLGIARSLGFDAGADERRFSDEQRHALALHVRSHERTVGVIVFEKRNHGGGHGHQLLG